MTQTSLRRQSFETAAVGLVLYAFLSFFYPNDSQVYAGQYMYDYYYGRILEGRLDLPVRLISLEGHYLPDGTAYTYHGLAPLLLRFALGWLLPTDGSVFPFLSPFLWCALGSACYHVILHKIVAARSDAGPVAKAAAGRAGLLVWVLSPGLFLAGNGSFYVEPISIAYAATGLFFLAVFLNSRGELAYTSAVLVCALCVALALHARLHVAACLAIALGVFGLRGLFAASVRNLLALAVGVVIVGSSAAGYLYVNYLKFGDPFEAHAGFSRDDRVQMGTVFLGWEDYSSERARGFEEFGRFNLARIPGNLVAYTLDLPNETVHQRIAAFVESREESAGFVRLEPPFIGILPLWWIWLVVIAVGLRRRPGFHESVMLVAGAGMTLAMLSYATVTFRYRAELWPLVFALVMISLPGLLARLESATSFNAPRLMMILTAIALVTGITSAVRFNHVHRDTADGFVLDKSACLRVLPERFSPAERSRLCADWSF
jgi:hypothetical protein